MTEKLCDINITNSQGETPLMCACRCRNSDIIKLLFNFDNLDFLHRNNNGEDALQISKSNKFKRRTENHEQDDVKSDLHYYADLS